MKNTFDMLSDFVVFNLLWNAMQRNEQKIIPLNKKNFQTDFDLTLQGSNLIYIL